MYELQSNDFQYKPLAPQVILMARACLLYKMIEIYTGCYANIHTEKRQHCLKCRILQAPRIPIRTKNSLIILTDLVGTMSRSDNRKVGTIQNYVLYRIEICSQVPQLQATKQSHIHRYYIDT